MKTGLMQALAKVAQQVAGKEPLDITNPAQLQALCLAAARIFGWQGDAQTRVNVGIDNRQIVVTEETRKRLQEKLRVIQDADSSEKQGCAPVTLASEQVQPQANGRAESSPSDAHVTAEAPISPSLRALGFDLAMHESVTED